MSESLHAALEVGLAGLTAGGLGVSAWVVARSRLGARVRLTAVLFAATMALYAVASTSLLGAELGAIPWLRYPIAAWMCAGTGLYGLLVRAVFEDRPLTWRAILPSLGLVVVGMATLNLGPGMRPGLLLVYIGLCLAILIHAGLVVVGGWPGDLDEARRRLRRKGVWLTLGFIVAVVADLLLSSAARMKLLPGWLTLEREAVMAVMAMVVAGRLLALRSFRAVVLPAADGDDVLVQRLHQAMAVEEAWREEGLSLAGLATRLGVPEYRLRQVILTRTGKRNFPAYVNGYRIAAAQGMLETAPRHTVAQIAFEVGFSSLSAFNRAFREVTGEAPVQWRKKLGDSSKAEAI